MVAMLLQAIGGASRTHIIDDFEVSESELLRGAAGGGGATDADDASARQFSRVTQRHYLSTAEGNVNTGLSVMSTLTGPSTPSALAMTIYTFKFSV